MTDDVERRSLNFNSLDEIVADAERLASGAVRTTGNHSFGQILEHLALTHDVTTGKIAPPPPPWYMKIMIFFMKSMIVKDQPARAGFKLPSPAENFFWPDREFDVAEALTHLKESVEYYKANGAAPKHPMFGAMTEQQSLRLNCRHADLHLSFVHPA